MRAVELRVTPERGWFGPFHRRIADADGISLEALHALRLLNDGSSVLLYEFIGDRDAAEAFARDCLEPEGGSVRVADAGARHLMFAHAEPSDLTAAVLLLLDEWRVVVDWPIAFADDRTLLVTLVGDEAELGDVLDAAPAGLSVEVERTGAYRPPADRVLSRLTARERETLRAAVDLGYYRNPRRARYRDVADVVGCAPGTVGHHLRNAEEKVMSALLRTASERP